MPRTIDSDADWIGPTDSDGKPCRFVNRYYCDACEETWEDQWSCSCNDRCPSCDAEIEPEDSLEVDADRNPV